MKNIDTLLDQLWSKIIKLRDTFCWFPGCGQRSTDPCHINKRRHQKTRWLPDNGLGGCRFHHDWEESHPAEAEKMIRAKIGSAKYEYLKKLANENAHFSESDKIEIKKSLTDILNSLYERYGQN